METKKFIPVIKPDSGESVKASKAALRGIFSTLLSIESCAIAVAEYKCNGSIEGHKVLDDSAAVNALTESAPTDMANQIRAVRLTQWEKCQVLNQVLRRHYEMDRKGKLTGAPSKRSRLQHTSQQAESTV